MDLWHGTLGEFLRTASSGSLAGDMAGRWVNLHRSLPGPGELRSWEASLPVLADALRPLAGRDLGVAVGAGRVAEGGDGGAGVAVEYHLPLTGRRIDVLLTGRDAASRPRAMALELKQWSEAGLEDEHTTNLTVGGREVVHPSEQALDYAAWMSEYHSAFVDGGVGALSAAFCHNLAGGDAGALRDGRFSGLLARSPLFVKGEEGALVDHLASSVGAGGGTELLDRVLAASFRPSRRVLETLAAVLEQREEWRLLDEQRVAFNAILAEVRRMVAGGGRSCVIVRGAPGTGKTVVAVQLLAAALRLGWKGAHATGGKAFTTALRSRFKGADGLFLWNMGLRKAPTQGLDLLLVDEAHRVRETSDIRWTPKAERGGASQAEELIRAARVTVFLLDDHQSVRPDEVGSSSYLRAEARRLGARLKEFDLKGQFRCGGCGEYLDWVDGLLGFGPPREPAWGGRYTVESASSPGELASLIPECRERGETARLVAGFCWKWSSARPDGTLVPDVEIGEWRMPWNEQAGNRAWKPENHPYTRWAETEVGEGQVGCIYSAQGFEFGRVGVIWGRDLVWRKDRWVAQKGESQDRPVKAAADMLGLVRNAYRVLLTRGMAGVRLLVLDEETRAHVEEALRAPTRGE